ncbi:hypothetical protein JCM16775_1730 [Leptotrichia hofstadii]|uniref:Uncharacterized protein n=1 Tax=Leptotrichia hofstadii TaxID=157688 RepID=A0A510JI77_9FUSO|nr:hypothetical protein [Leptotrichia hofstadii]BBM39019.1 hypothetical protein JCM16775_1730 [Leptotrichia hofstadii]
MKKLEIIKKFQYLKSDIYRINEQFQNIKKFGKMSQLILQFMEYNKL